MREPRLGDDIDDFCVRCKRIMNHAVVSVLNGEAAKVRCKTCHSDHDYRHEQPPPPKVDARKAALFSEVLKKVNPADAEAAPEIDPDLGDEAEEPLEGEGLEAEAAAGDEAPLELPKPKATPKAKAKATRKK